MNFRVVALPAATFASLFALDEEALRPRGIRRSIVEEAGATPCRVSLVDAEPGETVLLLPFVHHDVASPYRASGPIFVREGAETARLAPGEIPAMLDRRLLSVRAYDAAGILLESDVLNGTELRAALERMLETAAYVDVHNARPGCFNCRVLPVPGA